MCDLGAMMARQGPMREQPARTIALPRGKSWPGLIVGGVVLVIGAAALFVVSNP